MANEDKPYLFQPGWEGGPGRPASEPTPEHCRVAKHACRLGATDLELANILGVDVSVIKRWQVTDESFSHACKVGGDMADARVERGLYQRAVGGTKWSKREAVTKEGDVVTLESTEEVLPDTAAASRWLESRKRKDWGLKSIVEHQGELEVRNSRATLASLVSRHMARQKPEGE